MYKLTEIRWMGGAQATLSIIEPWEPNDLPLWLIENNVHNPTFRMVNRWANA